MLMGFLFVGVFSVVGAMGAVLFLVLRALGFVKAASVFSVRTPGPRHTEGSFTQTVKKAKFENVIEAEFTEIK
jgi:hypothetical protein